jgi:hypothetical protein
MIPPDTEMSGGLVASRSLSVNPGQYSLASASAET